MQDLIWKNKESKLIAACRMFSVYRNLAQAPGRDSIYDFYVLKLFNWANVIPITSDQQVVFVKQYRHGIGHVTLEIPGGVVDGEDKDPLKTAQRELFEETGYKAKEMIFLGEYHPNPAMQDNICCAYLAENVIKISEPTFDAEGFEVIEVCLIPLTQVPQMIANGDITHSAVITAFHLLGLYNSKIGVERAALVQGRDLPSKGTNYV